MSVLQSVLDFFTKYYGWIFGGSVLVLLAIIGSYAEKINFGQGKDDSNKENKKVIPKEIAPDNKVETNDVVDEILSEEPKEEVSEKLTNEEKVEENTNLTEDSSNDSSDNKNEEEELENFFEEDNIIDNGMLDEIDSMSLDFDTKGKKNKSNMEFKSIDSLNIKELEADPQDIWKL